ncbi:uncharacterized protein CC84DRAFT_1149351 [Paraphaeosphaeria sporulosa]|uniref:Uncharacterized protein n=1 Tax=Paraphaeosphaeria sporulosa TaxID=1460663 RepID=A0A177C9D3_9PLEO|nr:uncharacterized protein CC84DRAFT_1149351 [Paraphaeosphaeria sporulosa]OAG03731.1 hypothetical protein CC84DRAFT_1149351 [Paraphaeosphaeria sporulosa]
MSEKHEPASPPSYTDSLRSQLTSTSSSAPGRGQSLLDTITLTRATTIRAAIHTSILPLLSSRAAMGLPSTVLALLPSDFPLPPLPEKNEFSFEGYAGAEKAEDAVKVIAGNGVEEAVEAVRLSGEGNTSAFWRVPAAVEELERGLRDVLNDGRVGASAVVREVGEAKKEKERRGFFGRRKEGKVEESVVVGDGGGLVAVRVKVEEICLRTTNEFGLYDTMNRQCVVVRVDAGC